MPRSVGSAQSVTLYQEPPERAATRFKPGPPTPLDWKTRYLEHVREHGHYALAARVAGISHRTAQRERVADPEFDAACREAREEAADAMEIDMLDLAQRSENPVPYIVRLKALRPEQYIEKHAVMNLTVSAELTAIDGAHLLSQMLTHLRPPTQTLLESGATPAPALPPTTEPSDG